MISIFIFIFGSIIGSFINVCIFRLPLSQDIIFQSSSCPSCKYKIKWFSNIPILSFLIQKGKCKNCDYKIDWHYPAVELFVGLIFLISLKWYGISLGFFLVSIFFTSLVLIFFTDLKNYLIFDVVTLPLTILGILVSFLLINPFQTNGIGSLIGAFTGYTIIYSIRWVYLKLRNIEGMGLGDAKLFLMIGAWLGVESLLFILLFSSLAGSIFGGLMIFFKKNDRFSHIPYGCFIILATFAYILFGEWFYNSFL